MKKFIFILLLFISVEAYCEPLFVEDLYIFVPVTVTAYTACERECDSTPSITASNKQIYLGVIALSRDIEKDFNIVFGDVVHLQGLGHFVFEDRMNKRWKNRVDIYFEDRKEAQAFGVQKSKMLIFKPIGGVNGN